VTGLRFVPVHTDDELAQPLLAELAVEYATRHDGTEAGVARWPRSHPAGTFDPPDGGSRRRGYATTLLAALEAEIADRGYRRVYLTTGNRQPEAEALYDSAGYARLDESPYPAGGTCFRWPS
jgi:hypothetical protein